MLIKPQCPSCNADGSDEAITVHSGIGGELRKGFVHIAWGRSDQLRAQFTPDEARQHAMIILAAAEAAEMDAALLRFFQRKLNLELSRAVAAIADLRSFREGS